VIEFSEEHGDIREMVADFSDNELAPRAEALDEEQQFPSQSFAQVAELGLLGASLPEESGGGGGDTRMGAIIWEELARGCGTTASVVLNHALVADLLVQGGLEAGRERVPELASGETLAALLFAEPDSASVDHLSTTASVRGDAFAISGRKSNVFAASHAGYYAVVARDETGSVDLFLVEGGGEASGVEIVREEATLGLRGAGIGEVSFDGATGVRVGVRATVDRVLALGRVGVAALMTGLARGAMAYALQYASERSAFGRTIDRFEAIQLKFAQSEGAIEAARLLHYRAAHQVDSGEPFVRTSYQARIVAGQAAYMATKEAIQVLGGNGYSREYPVERAFRDVNTLSILDGSDDLLRLALGRELAGMNV